MVTSTNVPEILAASDCQETLPSLRKQSSEDQVCDRRMMPPPPALDEDDSSRIPEISQPCVNNPLNVEEDGFIREEDNRTSHDFDAILGQVIPEELAFHFLDPSFDIQGSAISHQGAQCTWSPPSSSFLQQSITTAEESGRQVEHWASRAAPLGGGVQPPNISYDGPTINASADRSLPNNPLGQNLQLHFASFNLIYDYQLEKLNREQVSLQKSFEETTSELKAELDRKMADIQREYDRKSQELDAEYINQAMKEEAYRNSLVMSSLLANGFMAKCTDRSVATGIAAVRAARSTQPSTQQQQTVQRNAHMNSTPPPRPPSVTTEAPISDLSGPLLHSPRYNTTQPRPISQQATVQSNTPINSTAPQLSVTAADTPISNPSGPLSPILRRNTTQPRPISPRAVVTAHPRPSVTSEALPLHSPLSNTPQPRAPPLIPNHSPSSYSAAFTPPVQGVVRAMPPHLRSSRAHNFAATDASTTNQTPKSTVAASTTNPTRLVQEQQQEKSNSGLVYLSDDEE